jgi:transcriptional regulator with XRE-family HTH domain
MKTFGKRLAFLMDAHKKSQSDIARDLSVAQPSVNAWVTDKNWPSMTHVMTLASYFNVSLDWLLIGETEELS